VSLPGPMGRTQSKQRDAIGDKEWCAEGITGEKKQHRRGGWVHSCGDEKPAAYGTEPRGKRGEVSRDAAESSQPHGDNKERDRLSKIRSRPDTKKTFNSFDGRLDWGALSKKKGAVPAPEAKKRDCKGVQKKSHLHQRSVSVLLDIAGKKTVWVEKTNKAFGQGGEEK